MSAPSEYRPVPIPGPRRGRWWLAGGVTATVLAGVVGTGAFAGNDEPQAVAAVAAVRGVTDDEALRLALIRFANHRAGGSHFRAEVPSRSGPLFVDGDVDHRRQVGFGQVSGPASTSTVQWNAKRRAAWTSEGGLRTPTSVPLGKPSVRALDPNSRLHSVLAFVLTLSKDRPEDARKLRRSGARWLGTETLGRVVVDVLEGPAVAGTSGPVRYLLAKDGRLLAVDVTLSGAKSPTRIALDREGYRRFDLTPALRKAAR
jgi:hypothetical protein